MERFAHLTPKDLEALLQPGRGLRVSMYLPAHPIKSETAQDAIRMKNLLREARAGLDAAGMRRADAVLMLREATALLDDGLFWRSGGAGVALFASLHGTKVFRLPATFEEIVVVGEAYHIKPLLGLLSGNGHYSLLALSQSRVRLIQGDRWSARDVTPSKVPTSLAESLQYDVLEKGSQVHSAGPPRGAGAGRVSQYHGHGGTERDGKRAIKAFFQQVDAAVRDRLLRHGGPLVLAGVDYLRSIYREANSYPDLMTDGVPGNPDGLEPSELHARAVGVLAPRFDTQRAESFSRMSDRIGTGLVASELRDVLSAARHGRVDTLFVAAELHEWGRFDVGTGELELFDAPMPGAEDLLDRATIETLMRRGRVFAVPQSQIPGSTPAAALLRY